MKGNDTWRTQPFWFISTKEDSRFLARIYSDEQRETIKRLISHGFIPIQTVSGKENCTKKRWTMTKYRGRRGFGFKMVSSYVRPFTLGGYVRSNMNSITYFIKPQQQ